MRKERINLEDTMMSAVMKMSDGNPGAMSALMDVMSNAEQIDPDSAMGALGCLLSLDTLGVYGTDIYVLWSDICGRDTVKMLGVLRGHQLGFLDSSTLKAACGKQDYSGRDMIDVVELYDKVCERLPNFDKDNR